LLPAAERVRVDGRERADAVKGNPHVCRRGGGVQDRDVRVPECGRNTRSACDARKEVRVGVRALALRCVGHLRGTRPRTSAGRVRLGTEVEGARGGLGAREGIRRRGRGGRGGAREGVVGPDLYRVRGGAGNGAPAHNGRLAGAHARLVDADGGRGGQRRARQAREREVGLDDIAGNAVTRVGDRPPGAGNGHLRLSGRRRGRRLSQQGNEAAGVGRRAGCSEEPVGVIAAAHERCDRTGWGPHVERYSGVGVAGDGSRSRRIIRAAARRAALERVGLFDEEYFNTIIDELNKNKTWKINLTFNRGDGKKEIVEARFSQLPGGAMIVVLFTNITERFNVERQLQSSEERFRNILSHTDDLIIALEPDGIITFINEKFTTVLGFSQDIVGRNFRELIDPHYLEKNTFDLREFKNNPDKKIELPLISKFGTALFFSVRFAPVMAANKTISNYNGFLYEITSAKKAGKDLSLFKTLFETSQDGIAIMVDGKIAQSNDSFAKIFGYSCGC